MRANLTLAVLLLGLLSGCGGGEAPPSGLHASFPGRDPRLRSGSHSFLSSAVTSTGTAAFAWLDNRAGRRGLAGLSRP
ncbi:MAG TPA: hypothetical protein VKK31_01615 [Thermoanaerobaculia bacterium]|nr:hypothetical protein [Thermoanaerobaculia bacterium]